MFKKKKKITVISQAQRTHPSVSGQPLQVLAPIRVRGLFVGSHMSTTPQQIGGEAKSEQVVLVLWLVHGLLPLAKISIPTL